MWITSYFNMDTLTMENGGWYNGGDDAHRLSTGIWHMEKSAFWASKRETDEVQPVEVPCDNGYTKCALNDWSENNTGEG